MAGMFSPSLGRFKIRLDNPGERYSPRVEVFISEDEFKDILGDMLKYALTEINPTQKEWFESREHEEYRD